MPEMMFRVRWPDGEEADCYSPSLVIEEHLVPGTRYEVADFVGRVCEALTVASARVQAKYGVPCSRALAQRAQIVARAPRYDTPGDAVEIVSSTRLGIG